LQGDILALALTAFTIGTTHTVFGPDHYLPFIMMARAGDWTIKRTGMITLLCGLGHVVGSVVLGALGILAGIVVGRLESIEAVRGDIAAVLLLVFGIVYMLWGLRRARSHRAHSHVHIHQGSVVHAHDHHHAAEHEPAQANLGHKHVHPQKSSAARSMTPWVLFLIFAFGPCEPLIPLLMYPAAESNLAGALVVAAVFSVSTIGTMLVIVLVLYRGLKNLNLGMLDRYSHFIAGLAVAACGAAILFLGL
jgi:nickel/cobalt transporter (NicO) family protein